MRALVFFFLVAVAPLGCGSGKLTAGGIVSVTVRAAGQADQMLVADFDDQKDLELPPPSSTTGAGLCSQSGKTQWSATLYPPTGADAFGKPQWLTSFAITHVPAATGSTCTVTFVDGSTFSGACDGASGPDGSDLGLAIMGTALASTASGDARTIDVSVALSLHNCGG